uniref:GOLD domain-containing protein n=1 Tax=Brassica oleracea var. oleracea TaxID=109376 RepID=A0A0D3AVM6_BRAOL
MDLLRRSLVCLLILTLLSPTTLSMRFELHSDQMKCISEDIYEKSISVGKYFIVNPNEDHPLSASHKVIVKVGYKSVPFKFDLPCCFWQMMDLSVKKLFNTVESIHDEMYYLDREAEMQDLNRSTNSKMAWFSFLSLGVCLSVVGLQFWHLKSFFGKKKLI